MEYNGKRELWLAMLGKVSIILIGVTMLYFFIIILANMN